MHGVSRRSFFLSSFAFSSHLVASTADSKQSGDEIPSRTLSINLDLANYLLDQHASHCARVVKYRSKAPNYEALSNQWRTMAVHLEDIHFDSQMYSLLPQLRTNGVFSNITESTYAGIAKSAISSIGRYGASVSQEDLFRGLGTLPKGDVTEKATAILSEGLTAHFHRVADHLHALGARSVLPVSLTSRMQTPHLVRASSCWRGATKQEQYQNCILAENDIAAIIVVGGAFACSLVAPCAAALLAAGPVGLGTGIFGTTAAVATFLTSYYCAPILS